MRVSKGAIINYNYILSGNNSFIGYQQTFKKLCKQVIQTFSKRVNVEMTNISPIERMQRR